MYGHDLYYNCAGTITEGPSNVTYIPGVSSLPIEMTCTVTGGGIPAWIINSTRPSYSIADLAMNALPGHSNSGTNILVNSPVNSTSYTCVLPTIHGNETSSDTAYVFVAGKYQIFYTLYYCVHVTMYMSVCIYCFTQKS